MTPTTKTKEKQQTPSFKKVMDDLTTWGPTFKGVMQQLLAEGKFGEQGKEKYKDLQVEIVGKGVRISFGKTSGEGIESSPSQGPPAKGQMKRARGHNKITTQNDADSGCDKSNDNKILKKEKIIGFAACQKCGEIWVCDGRIDKPNHTHRIQTTRIAEFVCPYGGCSEI